MHSLPCLKCPLAYLLARFNGKAGAINSGILAASIIALYDPAVADALDEFRKNQTDSVLEDPVD